MTNQELKDIIVYLQGKVQELEQRKLCECATEEVKPRVQYVQNFDDDDDCLTCSA
jgi:hypothetical protein